MGIKAPSLRDVNNDRKAKHGTLQNTYAMFPPATRVQIVCLHQDFMFFNGDETGIVEKNSGDYLGIIVKFDEPFVFPNGDKRETWNFEPADLKVMRTIADEKKEDRTLYANGFHDGGELQRFYNQRYLTNAMKQHSHGSKAYLALKEARTKLSEQPKGIVCATTNQQS